MSGCHQTRPVARRERTWLVRSRRCALGAIRDRSFHHGGSWASTISESVFLCVSVVLVVLVSSCVCLSLETRKMVTYVREGAVVDALSRDTVEGSQCERLSVVIRAGGALFLLFSVRYALSRGAPSS